MLKPNPRTRSHVTTPGAFLGFLAFALLTLVAATPIDSLKLTSDANANGYSLTNAATVSATNFVGNAGGLTNFPGYSTMGLGSAATNSASAFVSVSVLSPPTNSPSSGEHLATDGTNTFWSTPSGGVTLPIAATTTPQAFFTDPSANTVLALDANNNIYLTENLSGSNNTIGFDSSGNPTITAGLFNIVGTLNVEGPLQDSSLSVGSTNEVLASTGAGINWMYKLTGKVTGQTAATTFVSSTSAPEPATLRVSGWINVTALSGDVLQGQVQFHDYTGTLQHLSVGPSISSTGIYPIGPVDIPVGTGTSILLKVTFTTGSGSVTYDAGGCIEQVY